MLYDSFRLWFWILNMAFYRRVYYLGGTYIPPKGTATIYAANHTNGFMDPVLISDYQRRPVYFWVAASEIPNNIQGKIMHWLHSIPIYRAKEGNMHRNKETFRRTKEHLSTGWDAMFIAPEGRCVVQKQLLPLKKGCVRLSFELLQEKDWALPVAIIPTGLNYTYHTQFRSEVHIKFGTPILINNYKDAYLEHPEATIAQVTDDLREAMIQQMIYVEPEDVKLTEDLLPLLRNTFGRGAWPILSWEERYFRGEQQLAQQVGALSPTEKTAIEEAVTAYQRALDAQGASDFAVAGTNRRSLAWVLLGAPIGILGTIVGRIPHELSRRLRDKIVPFPEFSVSFGMTAAFFVWIFWSILIMSISIFFIGVWSLLLPPLMVATQIYAYHYIDYYREWKTLRQYQKLPRAAQELLQAQRTQLPFIQPTA